MILAFRSVPWTFLRYGGGAIASAIRTDLRALLRIVWDAVRPISKRAEIIENIEFMAF